MVDRQDLSREFLETLVKVARKGRTAFNARVTEHGLTYARARALLRLSERAEGITQRDLAELLELEQPTTGRLLDTMETLDLVQRVQDPKDRRANLVMLTEHGAAQADLVARLGETLRAELMAGVSDDRLRAAIAVLTQVQTHADAPGRAAPGSKGGSDAAA